MQISVVRNVLEANEKMAAIIRKQLSEKHILSLNLISSPGAGKTSLLEKTLKDLGNIMLNVKIKLLLHLQINFLLEILCQQLQQYKK